MLGPAVRQSYGIGSFYIGGTVTCLRSAEGDFVVVIRDSVGVGVRDYFRRIGSWLVGYCRGLVYRDRRVIHRNWSLVAWSRSRGCRRLVNRYWGSSGGGGRGSSGRRGVRWSYIGWYLVGWGWGMVLAMDTKICQGY